MQTGINMKETFMTKPKSNLIKLEQHDPHKTLTQTHGFAGTSKNLRAVTGTPPTQGGSEIKSDHCSTFVPHAG